MNVSILELRKSSESFSTGAKKLSYKIKDVYIKFCIQFTISDKLW